MSKRLALIIGNRIYRDPALTKLSTPDIDIGDLADILLNPDAGRFDEAKTLVNLSSARVRREVSEFLYDKRRDDLLLLYFSGHGVLDDRGKLYLALKDTELRYLRSTALPSAFIADEMDNSRSRRQVLILDCCHSGAFARGAKGEPGARVGTSEAFEGSGYGRIILTASDATQYAFEGDQILGEAERSFFTHYLVRGLRTGEADLDGDGQITIDEWYDYTFDQMTRQTLRQKPKKWSYDVEGEIVISLAPQPSRELAGERADLSAEDRLAQELNSEPSSKVAEQLAELYRRGLSAFWLEEWEGAARSLQAIVDIEPDYKEAGGKLEEANRQIKLIDLYEKAQSAVEAEDWSGALAALDAIASSEPDYRDVADLRAEVKKQKQLAELYTEAEELNQGEHWHAVVQLFARIAEIDPAYPDPKGLLAKADREVAAAERNEKIDQLYVGAFAKMEAGRWRKARELLYVVQSLEPGYEQVEELLERVQAAIERERGERLRQKKIAALYEEAVELERSEQWRQALEKMEEILALDLAFEDRAEVAVRSQEAIAGLEAAERRQTEVATLYTEAVTLLNEQDYRAALAKLGHVRSLDPRFSDRQRVEATATKQLRALARAEDSRQWCSLSGLKKKLILLGLGLIFLVMVGLGLSVRGVQNAQRSASQTMLAYQDGIQTVQAYRSTAGLMEPVQTASILFQDDFSSTSKPGGWWVGSTENELQVKDWQMVDGVFRQSMVAHRGFVGRARALNFDCVDCLIAVNARITEVDAAEKLPGVCITFRDTGSDFYIVRFGLDGTYRISLYKDRAWTTLLEDTESQVIDLEIGQWNTFEVLAEGTTYTVFANGQRLTTVSDATLTAGGQIGLAYDLSKGDSLTVEWDNLLVHDPR